MKRNFKTGLALAMALCLSVTGCGLAGSGAQTATEYVNDEDTEYVEDKSSEGSSTIVIKDLFEPLFDESSEAGSTIPEEEVQLVEDDETADDTVKIVFFGDSQIATGREEGSDIATLMGGRIPNAEVYNLAIGGTTASLEASTSEINLDKLTSISFIGMSSALVGKSDRNATLANYPNILETMNNIDVADVDYYFIEYGANDFFEKVPLDASIYEADQIHTFYGALKTGIAQLMEASPNAKIIVMLPFYGIYTDPNGTYIGDSFVVSNGVGTLAEYAEKARNVTEDMELYCFDGMFASKCDLYLDTASEYLSDGLHLTLTGRQIMGRLLSHIVNFEEMNEPFAYMETDFIKISEFDPYEYYRYDEGEMKKYFPESWEKYIAGKFKLAKPSAEALAREAEENGTDGSGTEDSSTEDSSSEGDG